MAEDTELSFRIYALGYKIKLAPLSVTWEQEPQTLKVWFRQRVRWVKGNLYVLIKNFPALFKFRQFRVKFDVIYFMSIYLSILLGALIISDSLFLLNALGLIRLTLANLSGLLWLMAIFLFVITVFITLTTEKGGNAIFKPDDHGIDVFYVFKALDGGCGLRAGAVFDRYDI